MHMKSRIFIIYEYIQTKCWLYLIKLKKHIDIILQNNPGFLRVSVVGLIYNACKYQRLK